MTNLFSFTEWLTSNVLWKFEVTFPNISLPTIVAIVGMMRAPQSTLVAETGSDRGVVSAGVRVLQLVSETTTHNITQSTLVAELGPDRCGVTSDMCMYYYLSQNNTTYQVLK